MGYSKPDRATNRSYILYYRLFNRFAQSAGPGSKRIVYHVPKPPTQVPLCGETFCLWGCWEGLGTDFSRAHVRAHGLFACARGLGPFCFFRVVLGQLLGRLWGHVLGPIGWCFVKQKDRDHLFSIYCFSRNTTLLAPKGAPPGDNIMGTFGVNRVVFRENTLKTQKTET